MPALVDTTERMRRTSKMTSPRAAQKAAPRAARTYGKSTRTKSVSDSDLQTEAKPSPLRDSIIPQATSRTVNRSPAKAEGRTASSRANVDPYSLSDLEDDDPGPTPRGLPARKRKHGLAFADRKAQASESQLDVDAAKIGETTGSESLPPVVGKAAPAVRTPKGRLPLSDAQLPPKPPQNRPPVTKAQNTSSPRKQARLIDALAAQKDDDSDSDSISGTNKEAQPGTGRLRDLDDEIRSLMPANSLHPAEGRSPAKSYTPRTIEMSTKSTKIKYTYSHASRSLAPTPRDQNRVGLTIPEEPESDSIISSPLGPEPDPFDMSDGSDVDEDKRLVVKSVHELRRAGANNRFSDELEDLLSRIGNPSQKPSTLRRNALLELSQKLQRKDFAAQFRDHTDRDNIATNVREEEDVVSGFALAAALVQFMSDRPAPHLLHKLAVEGIGSLLGRLLLVSDDMDTIASRKQTNLSKHSRMSLSGVKSHLMKMKIWSEHALTSLAPRTLALQLLDMLYRTSSWDESKMISADCLDDFSLTAAELMQELQGFSRSDVNFSLLVSIMESQSNVARAADQEVIWLRRQSSNACQSLQRTLQAWSELHTPTRMAALRMAINATNTSDGASAFDSSSLLSDISRCIYSGMESAQDAVENNRLDNASYESVLLLLGVMINILEHCPAARGSVDAEATSSLAKLHADNRLAMSEADSEEKSKLSVAFGYLAVSLGYLSLSEPGLTVVRSLRGGQGVKKLLGSIRDFIDVYRNVDSKIHGLEGLVSELQTRLM